MKKITTIIGLSLIFIFTGCQSSQMQVKDLTERIPGNIVDTYDKSEGVVVDEGKDNIIPLYLNHSYIVKKDGGFKARNTTGLGLYLLAHCNGDSTFDKDGNVTAFSRNTGLFAGIPFSSKKENSLNNGKWEVTRTKNILYGALGFKTEANGDTKLQFMYKELLLSKGKPVDSSKPEKTTLQKVQNLGPSVRDNSKKFWSSIKKTSNTMWTRMKSFRFSNPFKRSKK